MDEVDVRPLDDVPGAAGAPGVSTLDLFKWMPVLTKVLEMFRTGTGSFSTWLPGGIGKRWIVLQDHPPEP